MFNCFYTDLVSLQDLNKVNELTNILATHNIKFKILIESAQVGLLNMYSLNTKPSPYDYDDSKYSKIYTITVKRKDKKKAKIALNFK